MVLQAVSARYARLLAAACVTALSALSVLTVGAASARAAETSLTVGYTCTFPMIGPHSVSVTYGQDLPGSVTQGVLASPASVTADIAVPAIGTAALAVAGAAAVSGSAAGDESVTDGTARFGGALSYTVPSTPVPASGGFTLHATGTFPTVTYPNAGTAALMVGDLSLTLTPLDSHGQPTALGTFTAPCTVKPGQNNVLGTFPVLAKTPTTTTVASSANPSVQSQTVTYTATVNAPGGGGSVAFNDGGRPISGCGFQSLNSSGQATCKVTYVTTGTHDITAVYSGDASFAGSTSAILTQRVVVNRADLKVRLSMPGNASPGAIVTQTVTVTNQGPAPAVTEVTGLLEPHELLVLSADGALVRGPLLTWHNASMAPGSTQTFRVTVQVGSRASGTVKVAAGALSITPDPDPFNNADFEHINLG